MGRVGEAGLVQADRNVLVGDGCRGEEDHAARTKLNDFLYFMKDKMTAARPLERSAGDVGALSPTEIVLVAMVSGDGLGAQVDSCRRPRGLWIRGFEGRISLLVPLHTRPIKSMKGWEPGLKTACKEKRVSWTHPGFGSGMCTFQIVQNR